MGWGEGVQTTKCSEGTTTTQCGTPQTTTQCQHQPTHLQPSNLTYPHPTPRQTTHTHALYPSPPLLHPPHHNTPFIPHAHTHHIESQTFTTHPQHFTPATPHPSPPHTTHVHNTHHTTLHTTPSTPTTRVSSTIHHLANHLESKMQMTLGTVPLPCLGKGRGTVQGP